MALRIGFILIRRKKARLSINSSRDVIALRRGVSRKGAAMKNFSGGIGGFAAPPKNAARFINGFPIEDDGMQERTHRQAAPGLFARRGEHDIFAAIELPSSGGAMPVASIKLTRPAAWRIARLMPSGWSEKSGSWVKSPGKFPPCSRQPRLVLALRQAPSSCRRRRDRSRAQIGFTRPGSREYRRACADLAL
jgi:hypothetical protein